MSDRTLRWFVAGELGKIKQEVGGTYILDADSIPLRVHLSVRRATKGTRPLKVDITDDGVSIFDGNKPALNAQSDKVWTTIPEEVMREDSVVKLNLDQVANLDPGEDLTVELFLQRV